MKFNTSNMKSHNYKNYKRLDAEDYQDDWGIFEPQPEEKKIDGDWRKKWDWAIKETSKVEISKDEDIKDEDINESEISTSNKDRVQELNQIAKPTDNKEISSEQYSKTISLNNEEDSYVLDDHWEVRAYKETHQQDNYWGYGFVLVILLTIFGSITIATYMLLLKEKLSLPNIIVNVSIISLLLFLFALVVRYFLMIFLSFLQHSQSRLAQFDESYLNLRASILVPAFNEGRVIESSIKSLLQLDYPNYEIIVIDDGSTDDTLEKARKWEGRRGRVRVRVLTQPNSGKAAALNHGLKVARGDVIVCMDSDSKLSRNTLKMGMRYFIDDRIGAVAGNVKVFNRDNLLLKLQALEYIEGLNFVRRAQAYLKAVNIVPGPIGLFRRKALLEVGGWDSDTFAEDCDLTLKLLTAGWWIDYEPEAISYTEAPEKLIPLLKQRYRWTRGILQSMRKYKAYLINPKSGWRVMFTMWQMIFEAILWPLMNVLAQILFLFVALMFGISHLIILWWVQLTMLDIIAAVHSVAMEREKLSLAPLAVIYRLYFIQNIDVAKLIATVEELLGLKMGWGKLERKGKI